MRNRKAEMLWEKIVLDLTLALIRNHNLPANEAKRLIDISRLRDNFLKDPYPFMTMDTEELVDWVITANQKGTH